MSKMKQELAAPVERLNSLITAMLTHEVSEKFYQPLLDTGELSIIPVDDNEFSGGVFKVLTNRLNFPSNFWCTFDTTVIEDQPDEVMIFSFSLNAFLKLERDFGLTNYTDANYSHGSLVAKTGYKMPILYSLKKTAESLKKISTTR